MAEGGGGKESFQYLFSSYFKWFSKLGQNALENSRAIFHKDAGHLYFALQHAFVISIDTSFILI